MHTNGFHLPIRQLLRTICCTWFLFRCPRGNVTFDFTIRPYLCWSVKENPSRTQWNRWTSHEDIWKRSRGLNSFAHDPNDDGFELRFHTNDLLVFTEFGKGKKKQQIRDKEHWDKDWCRYGGRKTLEVVVITYGFFPSRVLRWVSRDSKRLSGACRENAENDS